MATEYTDRAFIFCTAANLATANTAMSAIDPDTKGGETFGSNLGASPTGAEPTTHYCANGVVTPAMVTAIAAEASVTMYKQSDGETIDSALSAMGLQMIPIP